MHIQPFVSLALLLTVILAGCAGTEDKRSAVPKREPSGNLGKTVKGSDRAVPEKKEEKPLVDLDSRPKGTLNVTLKSVVSNLLDGQIDLLSLEGGATRSLEVKKGSAVSPVPQGDYRAYVHVNDKDVPVLVKVQDLTVKAGKSSEIKLDLLEGASGAVPLRAFDSDGDLAIDRVELECGTDPYNAASIPGRTEMPWDMKAVRSGANWYRGDLHVYSNCGTGTESVAQLVARAENSGLDFMAIADRNTMAASRDAGFKSEKITLIPAMEWGSDSTGVALLLGPRTTPDPPGSVPAAQAECIRVQAQGGIWAIAHPCFPTKPWQWGLSYVNGIEVWFRDWRGTPPMSLNNLREDIKTRKDGKLIQSIAAAAGAINQGDLSANSQATLFWDYELVRGLMGCAIAGSGSGSKKVPLGKPVTYVHARNLSVPGIIEGLRLGRTFVSCDTNGPRLAFNADVLSDGKVDVGIGGVIPLNVDTTFVAAVMNGAGKKLQVLENGRPIRTVPINADDVAIRFTRHPAEYSSYRLRVIGPADPKSKGFGPIEVYAISSPIYAQDITKELLWRNPKLDPEKTWVRIQSKDVLDANVPDDQPPQQIPGL